MQFVPLNDLADCQPGLTAAQADAHSEAARVCLSRHYQPPATFAVRQDDHAGNILVHWAPSNQKERDAWGDQNDPIERGAIGIAVAYLKHAQSIFVVRRAQRRSGADYYIAPATHDDDDFEGAIRLEVSGTDQGTAADVRNRTKAKVRQLKKGNVYSPALAAVVGFSARMVEMKTVDLA